MDAKKPEKWTGQKKARGYSKDSCNETDREMLLHHVIHIKERNRCAIFHVHGTPGIPIIPRLVLTVFRKNSYKTIIHPCIIEYENAARLLPFIYTEE